MRARAAVALPWPGTAPRLLLLAEIDGRAGAEPVVTLSPANVYRPGAAFAARGGKLVRLRLGRGNLFPLDDEFPTETDCAGEPGEIEVITSESPRTSQLLKSRAIAAEHVLDVRDRGPSRAGSRA